MSDISEPGAPGNDDDRYNEHDDESITVGLTEPLITLREFPASRIGYNAAVEFVGTLKNADEGIYFLDAPERFATPPESMVASTGEVRVLFTPMVSVAIGGTLGDMQVNWCDIDWDECIQGVLRDGDVKHPSEGGADAMISKHASEYLDDKELQESVSQALRPRD